MFENLTDSLYQSEDEDEDQELIVMVEQYPQIYDLSHKDYDNTLVKDKIWEEIGEKLHKPGEDCKNRWNLLRSYFVGSFRSLENPPEIDVNDATEYDDWLSFEQFSPNPALPTTSVNSVSSRSSKKSRRRRASDSSKTIPSKVETALNEFIHLRDAPPTSPSDPEKKKKKLMNFFENVADTMITFSDIDVALIKKQIFIIVNEKEIDNLRNQYNKCQQNS